MADYPPIPFRDALNGPAGEYSDAYQNIVRQYRDDIASATALRQQQGEPAPLQPAPGLIHKSGNDIVRIDPMNGQAQLLYRAPSAPQRPSAIPRPLSPGYTTKTYEVPEVPAVPAIAADDGHRWFSSNVAPKAAVPAVAAVPAYKVSERVLNQAPPLNPEPVLAAPTATATPQYRPAPMMDSNEVAPPGSIIIGRRNTLDAPPSTTQSTRKRWVYKDGQLVPAQ